MPIEVGVELEGKVTGIAKFGAFVELPERAVGLVHISQVSDTFIKNLNQHLKVGEIVKVKVVGIAKNGKYDLSMKQVGKEGTGVAAPPQPKYHKKPSYPKKDRPEPGTFEDKITSFLKQSEERLLDLKKNIEGKQGIRKRKKKKTEN